VWTKGLIYKLRYLPARLLLTLKFFLTNRIFMIRFVDDVSHTHPITAGIPKGSILAPTLYNIFTSDIPHSEDTLLPSRTILLSFPLTQTLTNPQIFFRIIYLIDSIKTSKLVSSLEN
jgi:hypothetical protein